MPRDEDSASGQSRPLNWREDGTLEMDTFSDADGAPSLSSVEVPDLDDELFQLAIAKSLDPEFGSRIDEHEWEILLDFEAGDADPLASEDGVLDSAQRGESALREDLWPDPPELGADSQDPTDTDMERQGHQSDSDREPWESDGSDQGFFQ